MAEASSKRPVLSMEDLRVVEVLHDYELSLTSSTGSVLMSHIRESASMGGHRLHSRRSTIRDSMATPLRRERTVVSDDLWFRLPIVNPENNRFFLVWRRIVILFSVYSAFITPVEFGFFKGTGLPFVWEICDICLNLIFFADILVTFLLSYKDKKTLGVVTDHRRIAYRYARSYLVFDILSCLPWDALYKASRRKEAFRFLNWFRIYRIRNVFLFLKECFHFLSLPPPLFSHFSLSLFLSLSLPLTSHLPSAPLLSSLSLTTKLLRLYTAYETKRSLTARESSCLALVSFSFPFLWFRLNSLSPCRLEKDTRLNYFLVRICRLAVTELYGTHLAACLFYYLATTVPYLPSSHNSWISSLTLGSVDYEDYKSLSLGRRYVTSLYWSIVTMAGVGYGDIHPVNEREMIFAIIYVSMDMVLGAYLLGNITALIVRGSHTERFRDCMADLRKWADRNAVPPVLLHQLREHIKLSFATEKGHEHIVKHLPASMQAKVARTLYWPCVANAYLFKNCSAEFINQLVPRFHVEHFLPGEVLISHKDAGDQMYIIFEGMLEEMVVKGEEEVTGVTRRGGGELVGELALLCGIPQPFTVWVVQLTKLLRIDKASFTRLLEMYVRDSQKIVSNLMNKLKGSGWQDLPNRVELLLELHEPQLTTTLIGAAARGDMESIKGLIRGGVGVNSNDHDGRSALHLAAARGFDDICLFLIASGADVNAKDHSGKNAMSEAVQSGHDSTAMLLQKNGGRVELADPARELCTAIVSFNMPYLERLLIHGADPNVRDYDSRTPLHVAAAEGYYHMVRVLLSHGANPYARDRWENYPIDEAHRSGCQPLIALLQDAMEAEKAHGNDPPAGDAHKVGMNRYIGSRTAGTEEMEVETYSNIAADVKGKIEQGESHASSSALSEQLSAASQPVEDSLQHRWISHDIQMEVVSDGNSHPSCSSPSLNHNTGPEAASISADCRHMGHPAAGLEILHVSRNRSYSGESPPAEGGTELYSSAQNSKFSLASDFLPSPSSPIQEQAEIARGFHGRSNNSHKQWPSSSRMWQRGGSPQRSPTTPRITVHPYHPWTPKGPKRRPARLLFLPSTMNELLADASRQFGMNFTQILTKSGAEIVAIELVLDGDEIHAATDDDSHLEESHHLCTRCQTKWRQIV